MNSAQARFLSTLVVGFSIWSSGCGGLMEDNLSTSDSGGDVGNGGNTATAQSTRAGGGNAGSSAVIGTTSRGGTSGYGGTTSRGGTSGYGGTTSRGGTSGYGGTTSRGGTSGYGGTTSRGGGTTLPAPEGCDTDGVVALIEVPAAVAVGFTWLQDAVNAVVDNGTVLVCPGTIDLTDTTVTLNHPLTLRGLEGRDATILDGGALGTHTTTQPILTVPSSVTGVHIEGLTLRHGTAGGLRVNQDAEVTLSDSTVSNNAVNGNGGGIHADRATLTITGSTIADNTASTCGGGLYPNGAQVTLTDSTISGNTATRGGGFYGDGYANVALTNCTISGNSATGNGGGFYADTPSTVVELTNSVVSNNTSTTSGGGIFVFSSASVTITGSEISSNSAPYGGGLHCRGTMTVTDSIVTENTAAYGGGLYAFRTVAIANSVVTANLATTSGGGAYVPSSGSLSSTTSDWGDVTNTTTNTPYDVYTYVGTTHDFDYGAAASFTCTSTTTTGCTSS